MILRKHDLHEVVKVISIARVNQPNHAMRIMSFRKVNLCVH